MKYKVEFEKCQDEINSWKKANDAVSRELTEAREKLKKIEERKKESWSMTVYCSNCQFVNNILVPPGVLMSEGDCVHCRVRGKLFLVQHYPGKMI